MVLFAPLCGTTGCMIPKTIRTDKKGYAKMNRGFGNQGFEDTALGDELDADFAARNAIEVAQAARLASQSAKGKGVK